MRVRRIVLCFMTLHTGSHTNTQIVCSVQHAELLGIYLGLVALDKLPRGFFSFPSETTLMQSFVSRPPLLASCMMKMARGYRTVAIVTSHGQT
jgi:hypothetical protein